MLLPWFYPILDTEVALKRGIDPVTAVEQILDAGARILQFRHKQFLSREAFGWLERIAELSSRRWGDAESSTIEPTWLNYSEPRCTWARTTCRPAIARRVIGPDAQVGYSTHNEAQLRAACAEPADYLALGPIFGTVTKENPDPTVGLDELRRLRPLSALLRLLHRRHHPRERPSGARSRSRFGGRHRRFVSGRRQNPGKNKRVPLAY